MTGNKAANLRAFFADPLNTVTRERIFFNRLSFDLKLAAARAGYHLHLYEPDVDRDGFDIVAEDDENVVGWYQTKAVLASAGTACWDVGDDFLRPALAAVEHYQFDHVYAGRGGGVILIEIADDTSEGDVTYRYTDFDILTAIADGLLRERPWLGRGKPAKPARENAAEIVAQLRREGRGEATTLPKNVFVTVSRADDLLGVMGLHSELGYGMFALRNAYRSVRIDEHGALAPEDHSIQEAAAARYHLKLLCDVQPQQPGPKKVTLFDPFEWKRLPPAP
ncbi:MAG TPA: hypothetical protein VF759_15855 [Allosphingosinicella sp.]